MDITAATREGDAESNMMVERDEDYNERLGSQTVRQNEKLEESLRELLYLVLRTPEYQVG